MLQNTVSTISENIQFIALTLNFKAGLVWDTPGEFEHHGIFDSKNATLTEESWANLKYDLGSVAISDEEAAGWGLPKAQRFPWDDSKGLYFINGYHGIHCLVPLPSSHPNFSNFLLRKSST